MEPEKLYKLPALTYDYGALAPQISEELLRLHHDKHHAAYVNGANSILQRMDKARLENTDFDPKATFKELTFHVGGHVLHSLYWQNLAPAGKAGGAASSRTASFLSSGRLCSMYANVSTCISRCSTATCSNCSGTESKCWSSVSRTRVLYACTSPKRGQSPASSRGNCTAAKRTVPALASLRLKITR